MLYMIFKFFPDLKHYGDPSLDECDTCSKLVGIIPEECMKTFQSKECFTFSNSSSTELKIELGQKKGASVGKRHWLPIACQYSLFVALLLH